MEQSSNSVQETEVAVAHAMTRADSGMAAAAAAVVQRNDTVVEMLAPVAEQTDSAVALVEAVDFS